MNSSARTEFLNRVAAAVRSGNKHRSSAHCEVSAMVGYVGAGENPTNRLCDELRSVGAYPIRVHTQHEIGSVVQSIVQRFSIRRAVLNVAPIVDELSIGEYLRQAEGAGWTDEGWAQLDEATRRERCFAAELGVAAPDWAIAETGTLVYVADSHQARSTTLLPAVHLAIIDSDLVLPDLLDLPAKLAERFVDGVPPRNV